MLKNYFLFILLFILSISISAQIAPGKWESHLSLNNVFKVIDAKNRIYYASDGGIFFINKADNSIESITRMNGLSEANVSTIGYNEEADILVIAYMNSAIDLLSSNGDVYTITDIKRKAISGDKLVYNMHPIGKNEYLACGFGIVVLDLEKREIKETYNIGPNGSSIVVYDVTSDDENFYAATPNGMMTAAKNSVNLLDYSNWKVITNQYLPIGNYRFTYFGNGKLYCVNTVTSWSGDKIYVRDEYKNWHQKFWDISHVNDFSNKGDTIVISSHDEVLLYDNDDYPFKRISTYPFQNISRYKEILSGLINENGEIYLADKFYGAIQIKNAFLGSNPYFERLKPQGPTDNVVYSMSFENNKLWIASGGRASNWNGLYRDAQAQSFGEGMWTVYSKNEFPTLNNVRDFVKILSFPGEPDHFLVSSSGYGIFEFKNNELTKTWNASNSSLNGTQPDGSDVRVFGMAFDSQGNLWATNAIVTNAISKKTPDNTWKSYNVPSIGTESIVSDVLVSSYDDDIWMNVPRGNRGITVMKNDGSQSKFFVAESRFTNGTEEKVTSLGVVNCMVEDKNGDMWVGCDMGAAYYNPQDIWNGNTVYAYQPGLNEHDGYYHALLQKEKVTSIAIDGANRKWCGTEGSGVYLISENGESELAHFTSENSPLVSNNIVSIAIDQKTGMVYFGTDAGIVSYRGEATEGGASFNNVYAFPNPVRENFRGNIIISGLVFDTNVKITDVSGRLVYETTSLGGQAVWDGCDLAGKKVHTGVYVAFCASPDGETSAVTKILVIR